ncbi:hypothetical protein [Phytoactinopolyspora halophila]|nr:hypothetical protein [Phytoactinopolyspora halophila]
MLTIIDDQYRGCGLTSVVSLAPTEGHLGMSISESQALKFPAG